MADTKKKDKERLPKEEADKRRDELARRILRTPPELRGDSNKKKPNRKRKPAKDG